MTFIVLSKVALHVIMRISRATGKKENGLAASFDFYIDFVTQNVMESRRKLIKNICRSLSENS